MADVVVIGAGPVGLWTALQIKDENPDADIVMLEKHETHQRTHHLRIKSSSLPIVKRSSIIHDLVDFLKKAKNPRTNEIEERFASKASEVGIRILKNAPFTDKASLLEQFPEAKIFIGADGAHSMFRKEIFGDEMSQEHDLHYIAELKYSIQGRAEKDPFGAKLTVNLTTSTLNQRYIGTYDPITNTTPITLRTFIPKKAFQNLSSWATFKSNRSLDELRSKDPTVYANFEKWIKTLDDFPRMVQGSSKVTVTKLGCYVSKNLVKTETDGKMQRIFCLVGDAAFGVPFFRSMNNGLLCGTMLARCIARLLKPMGPSRCWKIFKSKEDPMGDYNSYSSRLARWEIIVARIKSFFIRLYISLVGSERSLFRKIGLWTLSWIKPTEYLDEFGKQKSPQGIFGM